MTAKTVFLSNYKLFYEELPFKIGKVITNNRSTAMVLYWAERKLGINAIRKK